MLTSAVEHYRRQQHITAVGLAAARRARGVGASTAAAVLAHFQRAAAQDAADSVGPMLAEQNIAAPAEGGVNANAFAGTASDGRPLDSLLDQAQSDIAFDLMVATTIQDAARIAAGVGIASRPKVTGYVRMLNPPSCPRCAILAGKFYAWNTGFLRHPRCDCRHIPSTENVAGDLLTDPMAAFRAGQVRGLSAADTRAINDGANMGKVVNVRRKEAGLTVAGRVLDRGGRPTPEGIYRAAGDDRGEAISLLRRHGYLF